MHLFPLLLFLSLCHSIISCVAYHQSNYLLRHLLSTSSRSLSAAHDYISDPALFVAPQDGLMQADKITRLPGQPEHVDFDHYAGYVTVHAQPGRERALFYYFAESPTNSSSNPLVLWLNGGPGCSSFGYGAMEELGPFRVNSDGKTLYRNIFAWNNVANVIFLDSPAGVGFSYSKRENYEWGDAVSAKDAYTFLVNWVERFPQYKGRDFYITGESYAGHYVPQLAHIIFINNNTPNQTHFINLKGIAMGNALVDDKTFVRGFYDHVWTHALISDETHQQIFRTCDFVNDIASDECITYVNKSFGELGKINDNNIYAPLCTKPVLTNATASLDFFDPCSDTYVKHYLNTAEVQRALNVNPTTWDFCRVYNWTDGQSNVLPTIQNLMARGLRVWLYSGDMDANVPITSTRYAINSLNLPIEKAWRPWYLENEVGGYVEVYKGGLTLATVRGAGHAVPSYQPERALAIISSFIQGVLPPS